MNIEEVYRRYQELQAWAGWSDADAHRVATTADLLAPHLVLLVDDFYDEIKRHPNALKVITGGEAQINRLKGTLVQWLRELLAGRYDLQYVARRWQVGWRHVEIGLEQVYTNVALSRLRLGLICALHGNWGGDLDPLHDTVRSLNKLLDLDLAIIEDAYQSEYSLRLQRSERLAAIGQVAGGVAHELRNPLNVVKTSVYYLLNARNPSEAKKAEHLHRIEKHVMVADSTITALSNFARLPVPNRTPFTVEACVREALDTNPLPDKIQLCIDCPSALPPALADMDQVRIVFANLIRNAREAMPEGGRLDVAGRAVDGGVEVDVTDTGVGIPAELLSRVMEPLYSTKARGLGLGLAIARAILEKNGGSLRAASEPGRGSTFTVFLQVDGKEEPIS
ncbi:MAG TPA: protoglobin domain-containing protein [Gemmataceae bacterium]|nr:protoglobin domain-containing protein [Gemmataceae bacterium]